MLSWASTMLAYNARPPDPWVVGDGWREAWLERLSETPRFIDAWLSHQRRDDFWRHGSVCEDYDAIGCPVYMVGGWADAYTDAILRFLAGYRGPRKGLIGPWPHAYPHDAVPGPAIGFLQECIRWWDHWLRGESTGIMDEPMLRAWMQDAGRAPAVSRPSVRGGGYRSPSGRPRRARPPVCFWAGTGSRRVRAPPATAPSSRTRRPAQTPAAGSDGAGRPTARRISAGRTRLRSRLIRSPSRTASRSSACPSSRCG